MKVLKNSLKFLLGLLLFFEVGCGVKGKPTPPDESPTVGNGESLYEKQKRKNEGKLRTKSRGAGDAISSP